MNFQKFLKQLAHYFPAQIAPAIINLVTIMILTRAFTVDEYGDYVLLTTVIGFSVTVFTQWLMQSVMFYRPKYIESESITEFDGHLNKIINKFIHIMLVAIVIALVVKIFIDIPVIYIMAMLVILSQAIFVVEQVLLQSDMKSLAYTKRVFYSNSVRFVGILLVVSFFKSLTLVLLVLFTSYLIFILPNIKKYLFPTKQDGTISFLKTMLTYGLPMLGWFLSVSVMGLGDRFLIKLFHGSEAVGLYSGNYSIISAALGLVFAPLTMVIHPLLMKYGVNIEEQKANIESLISKFTTIYFIVGTPIIVLVYKFREEIAYVFLGEKYVVASDLIPVVMIGIFLWNLAMVGHKGLEIVKNTKVMFYFAVITCITSFALNIILIQKYSYMGAAYGNMIAFSLYCLLVYIYSLKLIRWKWNLKEVLMIISLGVVISVMFTFFNTTLDDKLLVIILKVSVMSLCILAIYGICVLLLLKKKILNIKF